MNTLSDVNTFTDSDTQSVSQINISKNIKIIDKKNIVDRINILNSRRCNLKIFKIIYSNKVNYSKNDNGVFFNINNIDDSQLSAINDIICYYEKKKNQENNEYDNTTSILSDYNKLK